MPCDQQSSNAIRALAGGDYIDEKKAMSRGKDIRGYDGKFTCSNTIAPSGSCEVRQITLLNFFFFVSYFS